MEVISDLEQNSYPEMLFKIVMINTPKVFSGAWTILKPFMAEGTRRKIIIKSDGAVNELLEEIDAEDLPEFFGGKCKCEGGCQKSFAGPWQDYEMVSPVGIKLKPGCTGIWKQLKNDDDDEFQDANQGDSDEDDEFKDCYDD